MKKLLLLFCLSVLLISTGSILISKKDPKASIFVGYSQNFLLLKSQNYINLEYENIEDLSKVNYEVNGARLYLKGDDKKKIYLYPIYRRVQLKVLHDGKVLTEKEFKVTAIPDPRIEVLINKLSLDYKKGINIRSDTIKALGLKVIPDQGYASYFPSDARYRVNKAIVSVMRNGEEIKSIEVSGHSSNIYELTGDIESGDVLRVYIEEILRMDYHKEKEKVSLPVSARVVNIPIYESE